MSLALLEVSIFNCTHTHNIAPETDPKKRDYLASQRKDPLASSQVNKWQLLLQSQMQCLGNVTFQSL